MSSVQTALISLLASGLVLSCSSSQTYQENTSDRNTGGYSRTWGFRYSTDEKYSPDAEAAQAHHRYDHTKDGRPTWQVGPRSPSE